MYDNKEKINIRENNMKEKILSLLSGKSIFIKVMFSFLVVVLVIFIITFFIRLKTKTEEEKLNVSAKKTFIAENEIGKPGKVIEKDALEEDLLASPEVIAQGRFVSVEQEVLGKALFIKNEQETILRFEDFKVINGQNLHVYLSPIQGAEPESLIDLGLLKATSGNFNYPIDRGVDISKYNNVIIWSTTFSAFFGYANLYTKELPPETPKVENNPTQEEDVVNTEVDTTQEEALQQEEGQE